MHESERGEPPHVAATFHATGSPEEKLAFARTVRDQIKARIETWCAEMCAVPAAA